ncbi:hypothetical protein HDZ31DRAFT_79955 [Schizophyllum fasciatum]
MPDKIYLVSGANRGIGLAIVTQLAARPDTVVFAGARNPASATSLQALVDTHPGRFHILKLVSADRESNFAAAEEIKKTAGHLDVVVANAGISQCSQDVLSVPLEQMMKHFEINTNGTLLLFQAMHSLLNASPSPKFVAVTSIVGSLQAGSQLPINNIPYGASKAALNWLTRKLHCDFPNMIVFPIQPGAVDTDLLNSLKGEARVAEVLKAYPPIPAAESARGIIEQIDIATRETHSGEFVANTGLGQMVW